MNAKSKLKFKNAVAAVGQRRWKRWMDDPTNPIPQGRRVGFVEPKYDLFRDLYYHKPDPQLFAALLYLEKDSQLGI